MTLNPHRRGDSEGCLAHRPSRAPSERSCLMVETASIVAHGGLGVGFSTTTSRARRPRISLTRRLERGFGVDVPFRWHRVRDLILSAGAPGHRALRRRCVPSQSIAITTSRVTGPVEVTCASDLGGRGLCDLLLAASSYRVQRGPSRSFITMTYPQRARIRRVVKTDPQCAMAHWE